MAMEPEVALQEFRYNSDKRKKLDGFALFSIGGTKEMKDAHLSKRDIEALESDQSKYDMRKSLAWDSAFSTSPGFLEPEELLQTLNSWHGQNGCGILNHEEHQLLSAKYPEPEKRSVTDECSLRKSLAWDSAFFTSEGVLNPEELSLFNKGFKKSDVHILPKIEELWMSSESNCTNDTEQSSLASLEVELFEDLRASKPYRSEASSTAASISRQERCRDMQRANSPKTTDGVPKLEVKSRATSRRQAMNGNQPERIAKDSSTCPLRQFAAGSGGSDPPKILGRVGSNPMAPTKRVSLVSNKVNRGNKTVQTTKGKCLIVKHNPANTCSHNPRTLTSSLEFSFLSTQSSLNKSKVLSSPYGQSSTCRSYLNSSAIKSDPLTPSESRITNQIIPENWSHPTCSSVKKSILCLSPSVSTESCSPRSSVSTDHRCLESTIRANESCRHCSVDSDASAQSNSEIQKDDQTNVSHDGKGSMCLNPCTEVKGLSNTVSFGASRNIKPSGLRLPSPKIGFFDVDDSLVPVENASCNRNLNGNANRSGPGKIQTSQEFKHIRTTKPCTQQTRRSPLKSTIGLAPVSAARSELHFGEKNKNFMRNEKMVKLGAHEPEFGVPASMGYNKMMIREREEQSCVRSKKLLHKEHAMVAKTIYNEDEPHMLQENEKENWNGFENQLEGLNSQVRTLDVSGDVVIEFKAKIGPSEE